MFRRRADWEGAPLLMAAFNRALGGRNGLVESVDSNERLLDPRHSKTQNCPINERAST
jgi:hypothetical protein